MDRNAFWDLISKSNRNEESLRLLLEALAPADLIDFQKHFEQVFIDSYHWDLWGAAYIIGGGCSNDWFDYFRQGLILQGQQVFESAMKNPESLDDISTPFDSESVSSMAYDVYRRKTGSEMPDTGFKFPSKVPGVRWEEADLKQLYPRLWARFWSSA